MVRRYAEPVIVHTEQPPHPGGPDGFEPDPDPTSWPPVAFQWRGRLYLVGQVLSHWRERRAWWREALDPAGGPAGDSAGTGIAAAGRDRLVWRVQARPGQASAGVYDLACESATPPRWALLRIAD